MAGNPFAVLKGQPEEPRHGSVSGTAAKKNFARRERRRTGAVKENCYPTTLVLPGSDDSSDEFFHAGDGYYTDEEQQQEDDGFAYPATVASKNRSAFTENPHPASRSSASNSAIATGNPFEALTGRPADEGRGGKARDGSGLGAAARKNLKRRERRRAAAAAEGSFVPSSNGVLAHDSQCFRDGGDGTYTDEQHQHHQQNEEEEEEQDEAYLLITCDARWIEQYCERDSAAAAAAAAVDKSDPRSGQTSPATTLSSPPQQQQQQGTRQQRCIRPAASCALCGLSSRRCFKCLADIRAAVEAKRASLEHGRAARAWMRTQELLVETKSATIAAEAAALRERVVGAEAVRRVALATTLAAHRSHAPPDPEDRKSVV